MSIVEKWQAAYDKASFYKSEQNTIDYWNRAAASQSSGLGSHEHIEALLSFLKSRGVLAEAESIIDIGCGCGDYTASIAKLCERIVAVDSSLEMLKRCEERCKAIGCENVAFINEDYMDYPDSEKFDIVLACLNPATYCPSGFGKLVRMAKQYIVYFSMDIPIGDNIDESVYYGTNSTSYAKEYLKESEIEFEVLPYKYRVNINGEIKEIPFEYVIACMGRC